MRSGSQHAGLNLRRSMLWSCRDGTVGSKSLLLWRQRFDAQPLMHLAHACSEGAEKAGGSGAEGDSVSHGMRVKGGEQAARQEICDLPSANEYVRERTARHISSARAPQQATSEASCRVAAAK